jgi:hypothetical protein
MRCGTFFGPVVLVLGFSHLKSDLYNDEMFVAVCVPLYSHGFSRGLFHLPLDLITRITYKSQSKCVLTFYSLKTRED